MSRKAKILIASYTGAALLALSVFSAACYGRLQVYRRQTGYDAARAFEETVGGVDRLSRSLEKSLYAADGGMCGRVCASICADARMAETAMSALPFSTVELEQVRAFLGRTGDYAYTLCREAAERGFTDEQRENLAALSETAASLAEAIRALQTGVDEGSLRMDSREKELINVGAEEGLQLLSEAMAECEAAFTAPEPISYDGLYTAQEEAAALPTPDKEQSRALAAAVLCVEPDALEDAADWADGSLLCYQSGTRTVCISAEGLQSLTDARLVSEERLTEDEAHAAAEAFLSSQGLDGLRLADSRRSGALLLLRYTAETEGVANLDRGVSLSVALDDGSIVAYDASGLSTVCATEGWEGEAPPEGAIPAGLTLELARRVTLRSPGGRSLACWELRCRGEGEKTVTVYLDALTGKQQEIEIENG